MRVPGSSTPYEATIAYAQSKDGLHWKQPALDLFHGSKETLPGNTDAALAGARKLVQDPNLPSAIAHLQRTLARLDRLMGGGEADLSATLDNLRQITDNLRDLTENAKRYPSGVLLGEPPPPIKGSP